MKNNALIIIGCLILWGCQQESRVLFEDDFGPESQGEWVDNVIQLPPPQGLGYEWMVTPGGHKALHWTLVDELSPDNPKKGFWVILPEEACLQQAGRSHNSVLYCNVPVPEAQADYDVEFRQKRMDNDYIGYILGAPAMEVQAGFEFAYMTQVPGTDSTTSHAFTSEALGEVQIAGQAHMHEWTSHRIEVRGQEVRWYQNDSLMISGTSEKPLQGYFGMRQRYERNTCIDDVKITLL